MKFKEIVGIDVSKETFDARIHTLKDQGVFKNEKKGFKQMLKWVYKQSDFSIDEIHFIFEHTGLYSYQLAVFLTEEEISFTMVPGLEVKRTLGIARGKNDEIDAKRLARYGYLRRDELQDYVLPSKELQELKSLFTLRKRLVSQRAGYKSSLGEIKRVKVKKDNLTEFSINQSMINLLSTKIKKIEQRMDQIIDEKPNLKKLYDLLTSIPGIGKQNALSLIITTQAFTKFKTWRQYAAYCGTAPFPYQSGKSIKGKTKVNHLANKEVKSLLSSAARTAIKHDPELKTYYKKRIGEGKEDGTVINIIRCKLLARTFAVVNRGTPFINTYKFAC